MTKKLEWHTEKRRVSDLLPYAQNPRILTEVQADNLKKSLKKFNLVEIPAINSDDTIIAGHQRIKILQLLGRGDEKIEVRVPNRKLSKKEVQRYNLISNKVQGEWDLEKLVELDLTLLTGVGFDADELDSLWAEFLEVDKDEFDEQEEAEKVKVPKTKLGDVFALGNHRLICGDSTDPNVLKRLCGDEKVSTIYSDPVYNLKGGVDYNKGIGGKQSYGGNVHDNRTDEEYKAFLRKSMQGALSVAHNDAHIFYWCDQIYIGVVQELYRELGLENKRVCLWVKNGSNPTPGVAFNKCYEPCVYGVRGKPYISDAFQAYTEVLNEDIGNGNEILTNTLDHLDIWAVKRLSGKEYEHATSKPPQLHQKAIRRCTKPGDVILDSFGGSGSTLIAAEQLNRRAFLVELELIFCDLIIKRFEKLTGVKAKRVKT